MTETARVAARYDRFARLEAPGRSAVYGGWAAGVAQDSAVLSVLARIPPEHRQPPLVFAVTRMLGAPLDASYTTWRKVVMERADRVVAGCAARSIQTNDPLRCAALLAALQTIEGPLALLELGASAGLCLLVDRYSYRYAGAGGEVRVDPPGGPSSVLLRSEWRGAGDPPESLPPIVWRRGIDLAPLDPRDAADRAFLETLVWPGETARLSRVRGALDLAALAPPRLAAGDATDPDVLREAVDAAPRGTTVAVTTPGLLPHVPFDRRVRLARTLAALPVRWITIDPVAQPGGWADAVDPASWGEFALGIDGRPVATVDPLGGFVEWRADVRSSPR